MLSLRFCKKCVFPETKPDLYLNEDQICSACLSASVKRQQIDWELRKKQFFEILNKSKIPTNETGYDCVIPVSGGKDSTYQAYFIKEICGLNPLCVCFETTAVTELGQKNLDNLSKKGIDVIHFKKNDQAYKKMVIEGFRRVGDEMWPNHLGIFTVPIRFAVNFKIPILIWGENPQLEYGSPSGYIESPILDRRWMEEYGGLLGNRIQDMIGINGLTKRDLTPYFYPTDEEINSIGLRGLFLGHYFFWDARKQLETVQAWGFSVKEDGPVEGTYTNYENLDEKMHGLHDYLKFVKYGFGRATDHACIDIRNNRLTREEAIELVLKYDGKYPHKSVQSFIEYTGLSKQQIDTIIDSFTNPILFAKDSSGNFKRDSDGNLIKMFQLN